MNKNKIRSYTLQYLAEMECIHYFNESEFDKHYYKFRRIGAYCIDVALLIFDAILQTAKPFCLEEEEQE